MISHITEKYYSPSAPIEMKNYFQNPNKSTHNFVLKLMIEW